MSEQDTPEACWSGAVDTDHLGDVLIEMGERLKDDEKAGFGFQGATFEDSVHAESFAEHQLTIKYAKGGLTALSDPIRFTEDAAGNKPEK